MRLNHSGFLVIALSAAAAMPAHAGLSYSCGSGISTNACSMLNTTIAGIYNTTFTNVDASIYIQLGTTGLGESEFVRTGRSYSSYTTQFKMESTDSAALSELPATEPDVTGNVELTAAQLEALGYSISTNAGGHAADYGLDMNGNPCQLGVGNSACYNGVITISSTADLYYRDGSGIGSSQYDFFSVAEHETDEVLGTASCLVANSGKTGATDGCGRGISPTDLYRYSAPGTFAWTTSSTAYFSVDGGNSVIVSYHNAPDGGDYGDFVYQSVCASVDVQDYAATQGCSPDINTDPNTPEIQLLNAVGFDLEQAPEPATFGIVGMGIAALVIARRRRAR